MIHSYCAYRTSLEGYFLQVSNRQRTGTGLAQRLILQDKRIIGEDIKTVQFGWPLGMPLIRKLEPDLWEVRSNISSGIARVLFTVHGEVIVLLHGFIKKSDKTPLDDLLLTRKRLAQVRGEK